MDGKVYDIEAATAEKITSMLDEVSFLRCTTRLNVQPEGHEYARALPLGAVTDRAKSSPCVGKFTQRYPGLVQSICALVRRQCPNFTSTTIQLNSGYSAKLHVDSNNRGPSLVAGFGECRRGRIFVFDQNGSCAQTVLEPMKGWKHHAKGDKVPGEWHDVRHKLLRFNGKTPHAVENFTGTRYSMVLFTNNRWHSLSLIHI